MINFNHLKREWFFMGMNVDSLSSSHHLSFKPAKAFASNLAGKISRVGNCIKMLFNHGGEKKFSQTENGSVYGKVHDKSISGRDSGYSSPYDTVRGSERDSVYDSDCSAIYDLPQTPAKNAMGKKIANGFAQCIFKMRNLVKPNAFNNTAGTTTPIQVRDQAVRLQTDYDRQSAVYSSIDSIYDLPNGFAFDAMAVATDPELAAKVLERREMPLPALPGDPQRSESENVYSRLWELTSGGPQRSESENVYSRLWELTSGGPQRSESENVYSRLWELTSGGPQRSESGHVYDRLWPLTSGDTKQNPPPLPPKETEV
ncbi:TPA: hypothetical protein SMF55_003705 [Serratia liquefaciens]|nr:hypothetical protein [Serratia liquefaciens]